MTGTLSLDYKPRLILDDRSGPKYLTASLLLIPSNVDIIILHMHNVHVLHALVKHKSIFILHRYTHVIVWYLSKLKFKKTHTLWTLSMHFQSSARETILHCSWWHSALHTRSILSSLMEAEPEIPLYKLAYMYNNSITVIAQDLKVTRWITQPVPLQLVLSIVA